MSMNSNAAQPSLPHQLPHDTNVSTAHPSSMPDVANPSEPDQSPPVLNNRAETNSSEMVDEINQPPTPIVEHSAPEKSDRSSIASSVGTIAIKDDEITALKKAAEQGDPEAHFKLAVCYSRGEDVEKNIDEAFKWGCNAAELGHVIAQNEMAHIYKWGIGIERNNVKAAEWYQKAAYQGNAKAQYELAKMYSKGSGVVKDNVKAEGWYQKAAYQGDAKAQYQLAKMYSKGGGGVEDNAKAAACYLKAAELGHLSAMEYVRDCYKDGKGTEKNLQLATYWMMKRGLSSHGAVVSIDDSHIDLIEFFPQVLKKFPEFKKVISIEMDWQGSSFTEESIATVAKFIRSNSRIESLRLYCHKELSDDILSDHHAGALVEALKFNTRLIRLNFDGRELSKIMFSPAMVLLEQNWDIAELRQYVLDHPFISTVDIPTDVIKILDKQIIVSFLKSGQTKEATKKAIDEFLIIASTTALAKDSKLN